LAPAPTARRPINALFFEKPLSVAVAILPTGTAWVHTGDVVGRQTIS
jgi:hypothetical protein